MAKDKVFSESRALTGLQAALDDIEELEVLVSHLDLPATSQQRARRLRALAGEMREVLYSLLHAEG